MKKIILASTIAALGITLAPNASADPQWQHDVLCSSNLAYRTMHADFCTDFAVGSHGGGGAPWGDADGDGVFNGDDENPKSGDVHPEDPSRG